MCVVTKEILILLRNIQYNNVSIEMKFKLKSFSERKSTMLPRIAAALLSFGIKWVLSIVIFGTFFCRKTSKINDFSQKQMINKKKNNIPHTHEELNLVASILTPPKIQTRLISSANSNTSNQCLGWRRWLRSHKSTPNNRILGSGKLRKLLRLQLRKRHFNIEIGINKLRLRLGFALPKGKDSKRHLRNLQFPKDYEADSLWRRANVFEASDRWFEANSALTTPPPQSCW